MDRNESLATFVADRVRELRKEKGLTQEALSESSGLDIKYINKLENYRHSARLETIEQILIALDVTFSEFFKFNIKVESPQVEQLMLVLSKLPIEKQEVKIKALIQLLEE